jgi:hypothetical protein
VTFGEQSKREIVFVELRWVRAAFRARRGQAA